MRTTTFLRPLSSAPIAATITMALLAACAASPETRDGVDPSETIGASSAALGAPSCARDFEVVANTSPAAQVIPSPYIAHVHLGDHWTKEPGRTMALARGTAWQSIANTGQFYALLNEYNVAATPFAPGVGPSPNPFLGAVNAWAGMENDASVHTVTEANGTMARAVSELQLQAQLTSLIPTLSSRGIASAAGTIYVMFLPPGVIAEKDYSVQPDGKYMNTFGAHHAWMPSGEKAVHYAVIEYSPSDEWSNVLESHEVYEAITDANVRDGWRDIKSSDSENEIGDVCQLTSTFCGHTIQQEWSPKACACVDLATYNGATGFTDATGLCGQLKVPSGPVVLGLSNGSGTAGDQLTINGRGFSIASGATKVAFGPYAATAVTCYDTATCVATVPPGGGGVEVRVTVGGATSPATFAVDAFVYDVPLITSISPADGPVTGGTEVDINGSGFDINAATDHQFKVYFGSNQSPSVFCTTSHQCRAVAPPGVQGPVHLMTTSFGLSGAASPAMFTYDADPSLSQIQSADPTDPVISNRVTFEVTINGNAPAGGAVVNLLSSDPAVVVAPATVTIPAGSSWLYFPVTVNPSANAESVKLSASYKGSFRSMNVGIVAAPPLWLNLGADPSGLPSGASSTATVSINARAPAAGAAVSLSVTDPTALAIPATVTIPSGAYSTTFTIVNKGPAATKRVTVTSSYRGAVASMPLTLLTTATCQPRIPCRKGTLWNPDTCACEIP